MKRDMDLIRKILFKMEEYEHGFMPNKFEIEGYEDEVVLYHAHLLDQAGLIEAHELTSAQDNTPISMPSTITWRGYEFLENSRNPTVWKQAKEIIDKAGGASLTIWANVLNQIVLKNLGLG